METRKNTPAADSTQYHLHFAPTKKEQISKNIK
jgi:hypothetical protein